MSYIVLARRYRPQRFDEVIGQNHVTGTLTRALNQGRIAHAYLFGGPRGVGKTTVARILAKAVNCAVGDTAEPCGVCDSCVQITEGRSLDVLEIDAASNRGVEDVRNLRENIRFAPSVGRRRVVIVDEVHMFTKEAFNAFLKTLEEPPEHAVFILATTDVHQVPPTVLSRCQRFEFRRLDAAEVAHHLTDLASKEGLSLDPGAAAILARRSDGSLRDGLSLLDQMIAFSGGEVTESDVITALGLIRRERFFEVTRMIREHDLVNSFSFVSELMDTGADLFDFVRGLLEHYLVLLRVNVIGNASSFALTPEERIRYEQEAPLFDEGDLLRMLKMTADSELTMRGSYNPRLRVELLLQRLIRLDRTIDLAKFITAIETAAANPSSEPAQKKTLTNPTPPTNTPVAIRTAPRIQSETPDARIASAGTLEERLAALIAEYPALQELKDKFGLIAIPD
ncbi:MAG: DNA polymerase III subunit gamma/tau [bacterium]|nr:DNA polymerase III subunit gamma/tau [bacterium]